MGAEKVVLGRDFLNDGIISRLHIGDDDLTIDRGELPNGIAAGGDYFKNRAVQQLQSTRLPFDDPQGARFRLRVGIGSRGRIGRFIWRNRINRSSIETGDHIDLHGPAGIGIDHIVLDIAIFVRLRAAGIEDGIFMDNAVNGHLHIAALGFRRDQDGKLSIPSAAAGVRDCGLCAVVTVDIDDPCPLRHGIRVCKGQLHKAGIHPGITVDGEHLLIVVLPVYRDGIGLALVRRGSKPRLEDAVPVHARLVDILGRFQHTLGRRLVRAGIHRQVGNAPVVQDVAPQGHLGGIVCLVDILQPQGFNGLVGVAGCHDAEHLGVRVLLVGQILDAGPLGNGLGNTGGVGVHAVGGDLSGSARLIREVVVGVDLLPDPSVDGEVGHLLAVVIDIDIAQGLLLAGGGQGGGEHSQHCDQRQEER